VTAPTFHEWGAVNGSITTHSALIPPRVQTNDILLLFVESYNGGTITTPSGYTQVSASPQSSPLNGGISETTLEVYWKRATDGAEVGPSITDSGDHTISIMAAIRGCVTSGDPVGASASGGADSVTSVSIATPTTPVNDCCIVYVATQSADSGTFWFSNFSCPDLPDYASHFGTANSSLGNGGGIWGSSGTALSNGQTLAPLTADLGTTTSSAYIALAMLPNDTASQPGSSLIVSRQAINRSRFW
jgi:hypothetical protein